MSRGGRITAIEPLIVYSIEVSLLFSCPEIFQDAKGRCHVYLKIQSISECLFLTGAGRVTSMADDELPEFETYRIASLPHGLYYITQFLTTEEQRSLLDKVSPLNGWCC
jgi:hypothetical protein